MRAVFIQGYDSSRRTDLERKGFDEKYAERMDNMFADDESDVEVVDEGGPVV